MLKSYSSFSDHIIPTINKMKYWGWGFQVEELSRDYYKDGKKFGNHFFNDLKLDVGGYAGSAVGSFIGSSFGPIGSFIGSIVLSEFFEYRITKQIIEDK